MNEKSKELDIHNNVDTALCASNCQANPWTQLLSGLSKSKEMVRAACLSVK